MGIFKKSFSDEFIFCNTFQVIAQAIDVAAQTGLDVETDIEIGDVWALYFWTLKPFENKPEKINPDLYSHLIYSPGDPFSKNNNTKSYQFPSQAIFPIHPDDYELYLRVSMEIKELLESQYLAKYTIEDSNWQECGTVIEGVIKKHLPTVYRNSTPPIIFILTLALRSVFKDTNRLNNATIKRVRESGIFWISLMVTSLHFKAEGQA